jgi:tRNA-modifying protein YgfZ
MGMADHDAFAHDLAALLTGRAFVDLSDYRKVRVHGEDAIAWLHDLLTADIAGLSPGASRRSLLLTPTGRIRADVQVLRRDDEVVLTQAPDQPDHIGLLLGPYVLSSAVSLEDATVDLALFAVPDAAAATIGLPGFEPSSLGPGLDLVAAQGKPAWRVQDALVKAALIEASSASAEAWRIIHGIARMGPDFDQRSLPSEAALGATIDTTKGCFLGQESVARIANLGHPPRVLRHVRCVAPFVPGAPVFVDGQPVGEVTSAAPLADACVGLVRIAWASVGARLTDANGHPLEDASNVG